MRPLKLSLLTLASSLLALLSARASAATPTELRLAPPTSRCDDPPTEVLARAGIARVTLFKEGEPPEGELCFAAALELAASALTSALGEDHPLAIAADRGLPCSARCWFDRPTAAIAGPALGGGIWPVPPSAFETTGAWLFFATSPDLSGHWHWIAVDAAAAADGTVRVRIWSER